MVQQFVDIITFFEYADTDDENFPSRLISYMSQTFLGNM